MHVITIIVDIDMINAGILKRTPLLGAIVKIKIQPISNIGTDT